MAERKLTMDVLKDYKGFTSVPTSDSIKGWAPSTLNITRPIEYNYYQNKVMYDKKPNAEILSNETMFAIYDHESGLVDPKTGTLFVVNATSPDDAWILLSNTYWGTNVIAMYDTYRYMIQESWMNGIFTDKVSAHDWLFGYETPQYANFTVGNYYTGAWKDLKGLVSPVFMENYPRLRNTTLNIHTGNRNPAEATMMREVNNNPFANRMYELYDGSKF
jgi:hypothetical protein